MRIKLGQAKFQTSSAKGRFLNRELNEKEGQKNVRFSTKNWPYLGNGKRYGQGYYCSL